LEGNQGKKIGQNKTNGGERRRAGGATSAPPKLGRRGKKRKKGKEMNRHPSGKS
jgi:hypothetical protein